jgi:hypothetical protein
MIANHIEITRHPFAHAAESTDHQRLFTLSVIGLAQLVGLLVAQRVVDQCFEDFPREPPGKAQGFSPRHATVNDLPLPGIVPERRSRSQLVITNCGHNGLALGNQVNDSTVNLVEPLAQLQEFIRGQRRFWRHGCVLFWLPCFESLHFMVSQSDAPAPQYHQVSGRFSGPFGEHSAIGAENSCPAGPIFP